MLCFEFKTKLESCRKTHSKEKEKATFLTRQGTSLKVGDCFAWREGWLFLQPNLMQGEILVFYCLEIKANSCILSFLIIEYSPIYQGAKLCKIVCRNHITSNSHRPILNLYDLGDRIYSLGVTKFR